MGPAATATTQENIGHGYHMVMNNRWFNANHIANSIGISCERVENILFNKLGISKFSTPSVPTAFDTSPKIH